MNIITHIQGGLGNQLFQYATARSLALQKNATLSLDCGWYLKSYKDVTPRKFHLNDLNIKDVLIYLEESINRPKKIRRFFQRFWPLNPYIFLEKKPYYFDASLCKSPAFRLQTLYLMGYWQSYKYFAAIKNILQEEIRPKKPLDTHYQNYLNKIKATQSAMIHIRRGDYINLESASKIHGFIGINYYVRGMRILLEKNPDTHFFVFSDDINWALENIPNQNRCTFIKSLNTDDDAIQELELMTHCQNHLIANSSLSWWAAWLGNKKGGTVICPSKWISDPHQDFSDLLPAEWHQI